MRSVLYQKLAFLLSIIKWSLRSTLCERLQIFILVVTVQYNVRNRKLKERNNYNNKKPYEHNSKIRILKIPKTRLKEPIHNAIKLIRLNNP